MTSSRNAVFLMTIPGVKGCAGCVTGKALEDVREEPYLRTQVAAAAYLAAESR